MKALNNLTSNLLNVGQVLNIPVEQPQPQPGEYTEYVVKSGDSLYSIAQKFNTTVDELIEFNNLSTTKLSIGQKLFIPQPGVVPPVEVPDEKYLIYKVQSGDSLYTIAKKYNTTIDEIMRINNLKSSLLSIGQELKIPVSPDTTPPDTVNYIEYVVQSGDNLYSIAQRYNTTTSAIMQFNNLKTNLLSIGQKLRIPVSDSGTEVTYVVKSGDNLYSIAQKFNTTVDEIKRKNNLKTNLLNIGQILTI